jgi:hypothetical protein
MKLWLKLKKIHFFELFTVGIYMIISIFGLIYWIIACVVISPLWFLLSPVILCILIGWILILTDPTDAPSVSHIDWYDEYHEAIHYIKNLEKRLIKIDKFKDVKAL